MPEQEDSEQILERMRWLTFVLPTSFLFVLIFFAVQFLNHELSAPAAILVDFSIGAVGIFFFSRSVFVVVERLLERLRVQNQDLGKRTIQLRAVYDAGRKVTAHLSLSDVLQEVVNASRELTDSRFAALAIVEEGKIQSLISSGLSSEGRAKLSQPDGVGLLGHVLRSGHPYRTANAADDLYGRGEHPDIHTFMGMPVVSGGRVIGNIYLAEKQSGAYTDEDEDAIETLAVQAAIAMENARLYEQARDVAVLKERERIAMDLHDGAIQSLYAVGLKLEGCIDELGPEADGIVSELDSAIEDVNAIMRDLRGYIFDLRPKDVSEASLPDTLRILLMELKVNTLMSTKLVVDDPDGASESLSTEQKRLLFSIARQALADIRKQASAHNVQLTLGSRDGFFRLVIAEDGGHEGASEDGLLNITEWTEALAGKLRVKGRHEGGTELLISVPYVRGEAR
jgi:signal transduction histidine kinase